MFPTCSVSLLKKPCVLALTYVHVTRDSAPTLFPGLPCSRSFLLSPPQTKVTPPVQVGFCSSQVIVRHSVSSEQMSTGPKAHVDASGKVGFHGNYAVYSRLAGTQLPGDSPASASCPIVECWHYRCIPPHPTVFTHVSEVGLGLSVFRLTLVVHLPTEPSFQPKELISLKEDHYYWTVYGHAAVV